MLPAYAGSEWSVFRKSSIPPQATVHPRLNWDGQVFFRDERHPNRDAISYPPKGSRDSMNSAAGVLDLSRIAWADTQGQLPLTIAGYSIETPST